MSSSRPAFDETVTDLLWSLWEEFGISGVVPRRHADQYIDPEALILFTAVEGDLDPRLRDESIDWVIRHGTHLSKTRLKNLRAAWHLEDDPGFARYAATVNKHATLGWPTGSRPLPFRPRSRSGLNDLSQPSLIALRLRAVFGVGARAELMRAFLADSAFATAAALSAETNYGKRNVQNALEALRLAGLVQVRRMGNTDRFRLTHERALLAFVGPAPKAFPRWNRLLPTVLRLRRLIRSSADRSDLENSIAAHRFVEAVASVLGEAGLDAPSLPQGHNAWPALTEWADRTIRSLGTTQAPR